MIARKLWAEGLGTALLLIAVVGSGIMGATLADGNVAIALLANAIATGCMLYVIITVLGPISGAHFNPAVTLAFALRRDISRADALLYVPAQIIGGLIGVWLTHLRFDLPVFQASATMHRTGGRIGPLRRLRPLDYYLSYSAGYATGRAWCLLLCISPGRIGSRHQPALLTPPSPLHAGSAIPLRGSIPAISRCSSWFRSQRFLPRTGC